MAVEISISPYKQVILRIEFRLFFFENFIRTACNLNIKDMVQLFAQPYHSLYPLICVFRTFRNGLFDHFIAYAHIQSAVFGFIAKRLDIVIYLCCLLFRRRCFGILIKTLRQVLNSLGKSVFEFSAVRLDRRIDSAIQPLLFHKGSEYHFGVIDKVLVYLVPLFCLSRRKPCFGGQVGYLFFTLTKKQNIRHGFRSCRLFESSVRKSDCSQKFGTLRDIHSRIRVEFVHRAFARDNRHNASWLDLIHALGEEVIVNLEVVAVIVAVRYAVSAERHVTDDDVELIVRECRILETFYLHIRLWV